jgi:hypothetical protein
MSFLFATSHLHAVKHPQMDEDEEDNAQPMQRSGGVRAISHMEEPGRWDPYPPLSQRGVQAMGRYVQVVKPTGPSTPPADGVAAAKASGIFDVVRHQYNLGGNEHFMDEDGQLRPRNESRSLDSPSPAAKRPSWADESEAHADHEPDGDAGDGHSPHVTEETTSWHAPDSLTTGLVPHDHGSGPAANGPAPRVRSLLQAPVPRSAPVQPKPGATPAAQQPSPAPASDKRDPLTILSERFAAFPKVVESLKRLHRVPTGRRMIEKLATVAHKINALPITKLGLDNYTDAKGLHLKHDKDISPDTLGHEFQHLGEILFNTSNPFLRVEDPADLTAYPDSATMAKEFRAMRIQNQLVLERAQIMKIKPLLHPTYYDGTNHYRIPGSQLPWD